MPYIKQERREDCDRVVELMKEIGLNADGDLNYILFKFCKYNVDASYNNYKNYCGELRQCATEIERKLVAFYEEQKILENGNV